MERPISREVAERIGHHLAVIGQPVRIRLIDALDRGGEMVVKELALAVGVSEPDASQHLAVLRRERVVVREKRGRNACYRLADASPVAIYVEVGALMGRRGRSV